MFMSCVMVSCSEDSSESFQNEKKETISYVKKLKVIIPDLSIGDEVTKMTIAKAGSNLQLSWSLNDSIGVFPYEGTQVGLSMANAVGSKSALLDGKGLILKDSVAYYAYYPFVGLYNLNKSKIPMRVDGQTQNGNGNNNHVGCMVAIDTLVDKTGNLTFAFRHFASVLHMQFILPDAANVTKVVLLCNGNFITEEILDLKNDTVKAEKISTMQTLNLKNVSVAKNEKLELYMNVLPVDLTGKKIYAKIYDDKGICYTATWEGKEYKAGKFYNVEKNADVDAVMGLGLPVVFIDTPNNTSVKSKTEWIAETTISILGSDGTVDYSSGKLRIRGRGNTTWNYPKKPYALKLDSKAEILGMPKHKRWCLLANWIDRTLMRNDVSFQIARQTGLAWTPRGQFVEVVLNGKHQGNYYLCEQIIVGKNRVDIAEMKSIDIEGYAITGGYLVELDNHFDEVNKFRSAKAKLPYLFKEPDEDVLQPEQLAWFKDYINEMEEKMYAKDWLVNREYANYMDLKSFVDWWFVHELTGNWEPNHPKSSFLYKDRNGKLTAGPVWDFDWGTYIPEKAQSYRVKGAIYYGRLFKDPAFVSVVKERWALHKSKFNDIPNYIRTVAAKIKKSNVADKKIWPMGENENGDKDLTFDKAVERMISAYKTKLQWLDKQIGAM